MTDPTDRELIEKVAKLKGWELTHPQAKEGKDLWLTHEGVYLYLDELPTTDQCLTLLDDFEIIKISIVHTSDDHPDAVFVATYGQDQGSAAVSAESLPRAILKALLEVGE